MENQQFIPIKKDTSLAHGDNNYQVEKLLIVKAIEYFRENSADLKKKLTSREIEVAQWLAYGRSAKEIAHILKISIRTVESHIKNIKEKLNSCRTTNIIYILTKLEII